LTADLHRRIVFAVSALIFLFYRFPRGTLRQTVIADYDASAPVEFDPWEPLPAVSDPGKEISLETANVGVLPLFLQDHIILRQFDLVSRRKYDAFL
jgi:hypothetical protein